MVGEHELAGVALEQDTAGDRHLGVGLRAGREVAPLGPHLGRGVGAVEPVRVRLAAGRPPLIDLGLAARPLGGEPASGRRGRVGRLAGHEALTVVGGQLHHVTGIRIAAGADPFAPTG